MTDTNKSFSFDRKTLAFCDELAATTFGEALRKRRYPKYKSILYTNKTSEDLLLVCSDGTFLYAPEEVGTGLLLNGFKNGLRSSAEAVREAIKHRG